MTMLGFQRPIGPLSHHFCTRMAAQRLDKVSTVQSMMLREVVLQLDGDVDGQRLEQLDVCLVFEWLKRMVVNHGFC